MPTHSAVVAPLSPLAHVLMVGIHGMCGGRHAWRIVLVSMSLHGEQHRSHYVCSSWRAKLLVPCNMLASPLSVVCLLKPWMLGRL